MSLCRGLTVKVAVCTEEYFAQRSELWFFPQRPQQSQVWTAIQTSRQATHNIMVWVILSFFTHFMVLNIVRRQGNQRWKGRTINLTTAQVRGLKQPRTQKIPQQVSFPWTGFSGKAWLLIFIMCLRSFPPGSEKPTTPSAVPENPFSII